jgi:hypothetical protein
MKIKSKLKKELQSRSLQNRIMWMIEDINKKLKLKINIKHTGD